MRYSKTINNIFFKVESLINIQTKKLIGWIGTVLEYKKEHVIFIDTNNMINPKNKKEAFDLLISKFTQRNKYV